MSIITDRPNFFWRFLISKSIGNSLKHKGADTKWKSYHLLNQKHGIMFYSGKLKDESHYMMNLWESFYWLVLNRKKYAAP
jgi:hypothetical protein